MNRTLFFVLALLLCGKPVFATTDCNDEAKNLVARLESEALDQLSDLERGKAIAVIEGVCIGKQEEAEESKKDAFTELLLNGESADKAGNRRLKRFK